MYGLAAALRPYGLGLLNVVQRRLHGTVCTKHDQNRTVPNERTMVVSSQNVHTHFIIETRRGYRLYHKNATKLNSAKQQNVHIVV